MKKINVICPTFRFKEDSTIRKLGIYYLIKSIISKKNIRLCIIDSSPKPLEIFERDKSIYGNIIYISIFQTKLKPLRGIKNYFLKQ